MTPQHIFCFHPLKEATNRLFKVAQEIAPGERWTLCITYWDDDTFQIEYRHGDGDTIHKLWYTPHTNPKEVTYYKCSIADIMNTPEYMEHRAIFLKERQVIQLT